MREITIKTNVRVPVDKAWEYWTLPEHVTGWNFASPDWHCPQAESNLVPGGEFHYTMAARDGSVRFDFWGTYLHIKTGKKIRIVLGDGRKMAVTFEALAGSTSVTETFEPEVVHSPELQQAGWQSILDNFRDYAEKANSQG